MKRIISLVLALSMVLSICASAFAATSYPDLKGENAKYAAAVDALTELKIINGFPDGEFKPNNELTRAEVAKMLVICLGLGDQVSALATKTVFSDVPTTHWAAGYINAAAQSKIINGYPDGEFKPEKNVTYAEAFTMVLRALGYGNVVEAEGTWPTAYMLKAVELELTDDMDNVLASANATRGNTAILLWNMLRTTMWRIASESEKMGMTSTYDTDADGWARIMLNVKFPDYAYVKTIGDAKAILTNITITDNEEVEATVRGPQGNYTGKISGIDFNDLVIGMEVESLIKDYKKSDKEQILTLTPAKTIVAGFVTDLELVRDTYYTFKVDGVEYRFDDEENADLIERLIIPDDTYIVFEADGKKVTLGVWDVLPTDYDYAEAQSGIDSVIDEDDLIVLDGKWAAGSDAKAPCIITEVDRFTGTYFEVVSGSKEANFDVMFDDKVDWLNRNPKEEVEFVALDNDDVRTAEGVKAFQGEKNTKPIDLDDLKVAYKDNEYSDTKIEVFFNYLGMVARMHFGDVDKNSANAGFYVVTSNGAWSEGSNKGKILNLDLVGQDGEENEYKTVVDPTIEDEDLEDMLKSNEGIFQEEATFVWVDFDDSDENIETIVDLRTLPEAYDRDVDKDNPYKAKFNILKADGWKVDGKKLKSGDQEMKLAGTVYFYEAVAVKNEKGTKIIGFDVDVTTDRTEYDGVTLKNAWIAEKDDKVKYVFIAGESTTSLLWGKLESINTSRETVKISNSKAEKLGTDEDTIETDPEVAEGAIVGYRESKNGEKASIYDVLPLEVINEPNIGVVDGKADVDDDDEFIPLYKSGDWDTDASDHKDEKKVPVYKVTLSNKRDVVKVTSVEKVGEGRPAVQDNAGAWDRIVAHYDEKGEVDAYFIFTGIFDSENADRKDFIETESDDPTTYTVSYTWESAPTAVQNKVTFPPTATLEDGAQYTVDRYADVEIESGDTDATSGDVGTWEITTDPVAGTYTISGESVIIKATATKASV